MPKASEIKPADYVRAMIFSKSGAGKTELAATAPSPAFADYDNGMRTLINPGFAARHPEVDLDDIEYETFEDETNEHGLFIKARGLIDSLSWLNEKLEDDSRKTLVFDTLTSMSVLAMNVGLELNAAIGDRGKSMTLANARKPGGIPFLAPTQADFGAEMGVVQQIFDKACSSKVKKHVIVLAHERETQDKQGMVVNREPLITGSRLRANLGRWFDEVWYLDVIGTGSDAERVLYTASDTTRKTLKSRSGLPEKIRNPNFSEILNLMGKG
jgi:hypothetical protein